MKSLLNHFYQPCVIGKIRHNKFVTASVHSGRQLTCSSKGNVSIEDQKSVDPFLFVFHKWGITWNSVGLFFAFMAACYWNIFTRDQSLGMVLGLEVFLLSLVLPSQFFSLFQGLTKTSLAEWYVNQGFKVEQHIRKNPLLGMVIFLLPMGLCLVMFMGDSTVREDASLVLRIFRGVTYPYLALVLLFRGTLPMSDPGLLKDISDAIKTILKYPKDKPGKSTALAAIGGSFAVFTYLERDREKERQEARETGKQLLQDERRELSKAEDLVRDASLHPDSGVRKQAEVVMGKIIEHRRDHNIHPPDSNIVPGGLESLSRRVQKANEIHTDALEVRLSMISKAGETAKVIITVGLQNHLSRIILTGEIRWYPSSCNDADAKIVSLSCAARFFACVAEDQFSKRV
jgi:hypothetical protein